MKLEISKLKSQKELMKKNSEGEAHIVYGYLRAKDSGTAKAGTPYYVGVGNSHARAFQRHARGGKSRRFHDVPVPKNEALVRQFGVFPNRAAAAKREQELIARYGRKGLDDKGILLNRTLGGEGATGFRLSQKQRQAISEKAKGRKLSDAHKKKLEAARIANVQKTQAQTAKRYGIDLTVLKNMSKEELQLVRSRFHRGYKGKELLKGIDTGLSYRITATAERYGISPSDWAGLTEGQRVAVAKRHRAGVRGADLLTGVNNAGIDPRIVTAATRYGVSPDWYAKLSSAERHAVQARYAKGIRGDALQEPIGKRGDFAKAKAADMARRYGISIEQWLGLSRAERTTLSSRYRRGKRGAALLEGLL
jgi:hypothetical protein